MEYQHIRQKVLGDMQEALRKELIGAVAAASGIDDNTLQSAMGETQLTSHNLLQLLKFAKQTEIRTLLSVNDVRQ